MLLSLYLLQRMHSIGQHSLDTMLPLLLLFVDALFPKHQSQGRSGLALCHAVMINHVLYCSGCLPIASDLHTIQHVASEARHPTVEILCCTYRGPTANPVRQEAMKAATGPATGRDATAKSTPTTSESSQPSGQPAAQKASQPAAKLDESLFTLGTSIRPLIVITPAIQCSVLSRVLSVYVRLHDSHRCDVFNVQS